MQGKRNLLVYHNDKIMQTLHLRKFSDLYSSYKLGAVKNLHLMIQLLIIGRTTNLWKLKDYVGMLLGNTEVKPASHYKRLIRFFEDWSSDELFLNDLQQYTFRILKRFRFKYLILDGTSWKRGNKKYHYMVLSILTGSVAVPIYWKQLDKLGSSSEKERQELFEEALELFNLKGMTLLADREYIGKKWFKYLKSKGLNFVIRLRFADYYEAVDKSKGKTYQQMYDKCLTKTTLVRKQIILDGEAYFISMIPNPKKGAEEKVIIFLTVIRPNRKTVDQYVYRWKIECQFKHYKSNGFNLEAMNLISTAKSNLMMAVVNLAYAFSIRVGWTKKDDIRSIKYSDGSVFPAISIFRVGITQLTSRAGCYSDFIRYLISMYSTKQHPFCKNV
jgi:hypothetical protein